ncbi:RidA family protein [Clostridium malenominatum]|uniref:RidA family protein n=1 Tax=Clostridium malenominatum TaxID=1539 RepID=A0ABN1IMG7_9CLOT
MNKKIICSKNAPAAIGPYSQGVKFSNLVFVSGQLPVNSVTGEIPNSIEDQTKQSLENVIAVLKEEGLTLKDVVKTTVFLKDLENFLKVNEIYGQYFEGFYPARSCVEVARLPKDAQIEIEVIAVKE